MSSLLNAQDNTCTEAKNCLLSVRSMSVEFTLPDQSKSRPVENVDLDIKAGEIVCLVGESGCGKSVTVRSIFGLTPKPGKVTFDQILFNGHDVSKLSSGQLRTLCRKDVGYVFQDPMTYLNPLMTVGEQVAESIGKTPRVVNGSKRMQRIVKLFADLGIPDPERVVYSYPHQLSGGMRQRIILAIALARNPKLLILDEPTTALDVTVQAQIVGLIKDIREKLNVSVLFVTHDFGIVAELADRVYVMYSGRIVEHGPVNSLFEAPLHPYTRGLIDCVTSLFDDKEHMSYIGGEVPDPKNPPAGCRFHPRCPLSIEKCRQDVPVAAERHGHMVKCWLAEDVNQSPASIVDIPPKETSLCAEPKSLLTVDDAVQYYPVRGGAFGGNSAVVHAVNGVSLDILPGQVWALVGESGSGKSTLARMVSGLEEPKTGRVTLCGQPASEWTRKHRGRPLAQMVFQDPYSSLNPRKQIHYCLEQPLINFGLVPREQINKRIDELLRSVGLTPPEDFWGRYPHELSGGQRQRVVLARALAAEPKLLIADEPVSALDISTRAQILGLLKRFQINQDLSILLITHDLAVVKSVAEQVGVMYLGNLLEVGSAADVINNPRHPYTKALVAAIPVPDPSRKLPDFSEMLTGEPPSPVHLPAGCPFHPRCPVASTICKEKMPSWKQIKPGHMAACHFC